MAAQGFLLIATFLLVLMVLARPLGSGLARLINDIPLPGTAGVERVLFSALGVSDREMNWKQYLSAILGLNMLGLAVLFFMLLGQHYLPLNPQQLPGLSWDLALNTAVSFVTNTNWQSYSGETTLSYFSQMAGLTVQNFLSAASGIAVIFALIRAFTRQSMSTLGNAWVDLLRITLWVLVPVALLIALFFIQQGALQNFLPYQAVNTVEGAQQLLPMGPVASQEAIKMLGTNGGGFFNANSSHPFENPTALTNFVQMLAIFLIPTALCFAFGEVAGDRRQGRMLLWAMSVIFVICVGVVMWAEVQGNPHLLALGADSSINMEGMDRWTTSLASAGKGEELSPLPAHLIANAKSFLDWIMPAALHHRTMKEAWDRAGKIPSYRNDAPSDHSLFTFSITSQTDLLTEEEKEALDRKGIEEILPSPKEENREEKTELSHFLTHLPCKAPGWMDAQLSWTYGHRGALETPAKLTATAAVHLRELAEYKESDEPPLPSVILAQDGADALDTDYAAPPLFLSGDETKYQGTSFGTLMHRAMEMIDFTTLPAEEAAIEDALHGLVEKKVFTEEEGHILLSGKRKPTPVSSLLTFARSPLAEKMKTASAIRKEMPFSILLPARSFYPDCEEGENIFLQGVMDCLLEYEKDFIIIDYKTDRTMTEEELKSHYKIQLQVYGEAAEKLLGKPVSHLYLWSFTYGKAIEVEKM